MGWGGKLIDLVPTPYRASQWFPNYRMLHLLCDDFNGSYGADLNGQNKGLYVAHAYSPSKSPNTPFRESPPGEPQNWPEYQIFGTKNPVPETFTFPATDPVHEYCNLEVEFKNAVNPTKFKTEFFDLLVNMRSAMAPAYEVRPRYYWTVDLPYQEDCWIDPGDPATQPPVGAWRTIAYPYKWAEPGLDSRMFDSEEQSELKKLWGYLPDWGLTRYRNPYSLFWVAVGQIVSLVNVRQYGIDPLHLQVTGTFPYIVDYEVPTEQNFKQEPWATLLPQGTKKMKKAFIDYQGL